MTTKQEQASRQVIVLNLQREAVISCDYTQKVQNNFRNNTQTSLHSVCQRPLKNHLLQVTPRWTATFDSFKCSYCFLKINVVIIRQDSTQPTTRWCLFYSDGKLCAKFYEFSHQMSSCSWSD